MLPPAGGFVGKIKISVDVVVIAGKIKITVFVTVGVVDGIPVGGFVNVGRFVDVTATVGRIKIAV